MLLDADLVVGDEHSGVFVACANMTQLCTERVSCELGRFSKVGLAEGFLFHAYLHEPSSVREARMGHCHV
jgi:hypothetical protein